MIIATETIDKLTIDIDTQANQDTANIDNLISKLEKLNDVLSSTNVSSVLEALNNISTKANEVTTNLNKINNVNFAIVRTNMTTILDKLTAISAKANDANTSISNLGSGTKPKTSGKTETKTTTSVEQPSFDEMWKNADNAAKKVQAIFKNLGIGIANALKGAMGGVKNAIGGGIKAGAFTAKSGLVGLVSAGVKGLKSMISSAMGFAGKLLHIQKIAATTGGTLLKSFNKNVVNRIKLFSLALLGARSAFTAIRKAASEYMNYDTALSDTLQNNWAVLGSIMAPVLEKLISLFSTAVAYIVNFIKVLTGIDVVARANAKALDSQSKSAKNALGNLAKFDDLNVVDFDKGSDTLSPLTIDTIDTKPLDDFMAKIKDNDWYGLGMEISRKFNEGLALINFDEIIEKAAQFGTNFSDLLNGLIDGMDWEQLGSKVGQGLQAIVSALYNFIYGTNWGTFGNGIGTALVNAMDNVDFTQLGAVLTGKFNGVVESLAGFVSTPDLWSNLGISLADGFNGAWDSIDWNALATLINDGIKGVLDSTLVFLQNVNWEQVGLDIWNFIASIDWAGIVSKLVELLGASIAGMGQLLWGFIETAVADIGNYFSEKMDECGGDIIGGLFKGIIDAIAGIGQWLYDNVVSPFIDGFKEMFGIHSPSTVMAEMGTYLVEGLKNGLLGIWDSVKSIFTDLGNNISEKFTNIMGDIKEIFSIDNIKRHFTEVVNAIKNVFSNIPNWFKDKFSEAWTKVKNVFSTGGKIFTGITDGIGNLFKTVVNGIIGGLNKIIAVPFNSINGILNKIKNISFLGISPFKGLWKENLLSVPQIPKLATGTNKIEYEGLYHLHKDEAVVPKKYNPAVNNKVYDDNNEKIITKIGELIDTIKNQETTNIINVGGKTMYKQSLTYANRQANITGENMINV